ncbi:MAG: type IV toxin-antitoxin system AbiEi family antitoxin domain-containing protein [Acidimicrobiales bacterium]
MPTDALIAWRSKRDKVRYSKRVPTDRFTELAGIAADQHGYFELAGSRAVGYADNTIAQMARRGRIERVSQGVYRIPFLPSGRLGPYMAAAMWPAGVRGVISRDAAMDLWEVGDVNPAKIHITVPQAHRVQREVPAAYELHREELAPHEVTEIEGVPVVTLGRAIRACAAAHMATDLLEQAIRHGRGQGLLTEATAKALTDELGVDRVAVGRA